MLAKRIVNILVVSVCVYNETSMQQWTKVTEVSMPMCHFHTTLEHSVMFWDRMCSKLNKFGLLCLIFLFYMIQTTQAPRAETTSSIPVKHYTALALTVASRLCSQHPCIAYDLPYDITLLHTLIPLELTKLDLTDIHEPQLQPPNATISLEEKPTVLPKRSFPLQG